MTVKEKPVTEVVALKTRKGERKETRVTLFSINDKDYDIPTSIRPNRALQILRVFRLQGENAGVDFMLENMLGVDAYHALLDFDDLETADFEKIIKIAYQIVAGATESPKA